MQIMRIALLVVTGALCTAGNASAQDAPYPSKLVRIVVPSSPGSMTDVLARALGERLSQTWQQQIIVENRPGIGGMASVAKAVPDGYTIMLVGNGFAILSKINANLPFDPLRDFVGISKIATMPTILVIPSSSPAKSLTEFIDIARAQSGEMSYASAGLGSTAYIGAELFKQAGQFGMVHVPYKGTPDALTSIMRGDTAMFFTPAISGIELIQSGKVRGLAVAGPARLPNLPTVPTFAEAGLPQFVYDAWVAMVAPANTRQPILKKISADVETVMKLPEIQNLFLQQGVMPVGSTSEEITALLNADAARYKQLLPEPRN